MPSVEFIAFVHSISSAGEAALGEWSPVRSRIDNDGVNKGRLTAQRSLGLLTVLAEKTRGNLDREEAAALTQGIEALSELLARPRPTESDA